MLKYKLFFAICLSTAVIVFSQEPENKIHYSQEIILSGENEYKEIILDKDVITKAKSNLSDIRIVDENKNDVPYFLYDSQSYEEVVDALFESDYLGSFIKEEENIGIFEYFNFAIRKEENIDVEHQDVYGNQIELEMNNSGFAETVEVLGSHDGINWTFVTNAFVYDVNEYSQKTISFYQTEKYSFYRIKAKDKTVQINSLKLVYTEVNESKELFTKEFHPRFSIEEKNKNTIITIPKDEVRFLHIDTIQFETSGTFQRDVSALYQREEIYNFPFREELLEKNYINVDMSVRDEDFVITIFNGDDKALAITNLTVTYRLQKLVFDASEGKSFSLTYGDSTLAKPNYDIANYGEYILQEGVDLCALGKVTETAEKSDFAFGKLFMNIAIILAAVVLMIIIIAGMKKHGT
jgi:hypothetical protein